MFLLSGEILSLSCGEPYMKTMNAGKTKPGHLAYFDFYIIASLRACPNNRVVMRPSQKFETNAPATVCPLTSDF